MAEIDCTLRGYIYGVICDEFSFLDPLGEATVIGIPGEHQIPERGSLTHNNQEVKPFVKQIDEKELNKRVEGNKLVLRGTTDETGFFCINQPDYRGEPLDIYVIVGQIPLKQDDEREYVQLDEPAIYSLGTYQPSTSDQEQWQTNLVIPSEVYCQLKKRADVWSIVGQVTFCDTDVPANQVSVSAFDVDITQHDPLGTDVTNGAGYFRIDYPGSAFREGTIIDVELFGGPDLFFKIEDSDGNVLLGENANKGRHGDRCNAGPCFCVNLCAPVEVPPPKDGVPTVWTAVGKAEFLIPDSYSTNDFDADGYGVQGGTHYAFTGNSLKMMGSITYLDDPHTVEYRFRVSDKHGTNGGSTVPESDFNQTVGSVASGDLNLFQNGVEIGQVVRFFPSYKMVRVYANSSDLDNDGWLDIKKAIESAFISDPDVTPADIPSFINSPYGGWKQNILLAIDTTKIQAPISPGGATNPGDAVTSGIVNVADETYALRFEARIRNYSTNAVTALPADGTTLNAIVLDNTEAVRKLAMVAHSSDACKPLSGQIDVAYTVYHPHLGHANINVKSNESPPVFNKNLNDSNLPFSVNADPNGTNPMNNGSLNINNNQVGSNQSLHKCTYLVTLGVGWRMHNGDGALALGDPQTTFWYEG